MSKAVPELRFPGFKGEWQTKSIGRLLKRASDPVRVEQEETYREIGVRSHGRGVFHKAPVSGAELGDKRVFHVVPDALVLNIVFAWEQAVAMTSSDEQGFIASHRFPMFLENAGQSYLPFIRQLLLTPRGKMLLEIASPGGAGRNKTLGQDAFIKLKTRVPERDEQKRIADFLDATSRKITLLTDKKTALEDYKRGLMQRLFSRELRFTQDDGSAFPDWEERRLGAYLQAESMRAPANTDIPVYSSSREGLKRQEDYFADRKLANEGDYGVVPTGFITYRHMSDDLTFKFNLNDLGYPIAVSKEYPVFTTKGMDIKFLTYWLNNSLAFARFAIMQKKGGTRTRLYFKDLQSLRALLPHSDEQRKIAAVLSALDAKIDALSKKISEMEAFKKGLLQKLFV